jgi:hypothetical protein
VKGQIELVLRWACPCENNEELQVVSRLPAWANCAMGEATFREAWAQFAGEIKAHSPAAPSVEQDERGAFERALISYAMDEAESTDAEVIRQSRARVMALFDAARAASTSANVAQGEKRDAKSDRYFLVVENGSYLIVDRERSEMRGDEPDYFVLAWTPNKDDAKFVCDVMNESREF